MIKSINTRLRPTVPSYTIERIGEDPDRPGNAIYKLCMTAAVTEIAAELGGEGGGLTLSGPQSAAVVLCVCSGDSAEVLGPPEQCEVVIPEDGNRDTDSGDEMVSY